MANDEINNLDIKRIEVIHNLIEASHIGRLKWDKLGSDTYYAQANAMAVRINSAAHSSKADRRINKLEIIDSDGETLDSFSYISDAEGEIGKKLNQLLLTAIDSIGNERARDLDRFLEDLRA